MDAIDLLNSDEADLPKTRDCDFPSFIDRVLIEYRMHMQRVVNRRFIDWVVTREIPLVDRLSDAIRDVVSRAVAGDRTGAYNRLDQALIAQGPHLRALMPTGDMSTEINPMYRFRMNPPAPCGKGHLFHIPFEARHKVREQRYSVAGLPSLYLGGSTHLCWRELGEPDKASIAVARFHAVPTTICACSIVVVGWRFTQTGYARNHRNSLGRRRMQP